MNNPDLIAFATQTSKTGTIYTRIGAAWKNKKGGFGIRLSCLPVSGEIVLFPPKAPEETVPS